MKKIYIIAIIILALFGFSSCADFLNIDPDGTYSDKDISIQPDQAVIAAYSMLGNDHYDSPFDLWPYGNVRSDDAYKGGRDESDIQDFHFYETETNIWPTFGEPDVFFFSCYIGIGRANIALRMLNKLDENKFKLKNTRIAECRFLRAHFYFLLKIMFKYVPYIDENVPNDDYHKISNVALSNDALWAKIAEDFQYAYDHLPEKQTDAGRANKYAAAAYLAKVYLYKAYRQDKKHNVTSIDAADMQQVLKYTDIVMSSSYGLAPDFADNFLPGKGIYENGVESLFAVQFSQNDGTLKGRLNFGDALNVPLNTTGACDFQKPSQNLVNAFKTVDGLPDFNHYNDKDYDSQTDKVDPRLYHTVAIVGLPYKYDDTHIFQKEHSRNPAEYGYYSSLKENVKVGDESSVLIDPFRANTKNKIILRYADVLLMRVEALIELHREKEARPLINEVRRRAANSLKLIPYAKNTDIAEYPDNALWTNDYARQALRWERRLELAMEGNRFFDLVRWGIADKVMNTYYETEQTKRPFLSIAHFDKNKEEYVPIPQNQINFSKGLYQQNAGY